MTEWDFDKNDKLPNEVMKNSHYKAHWKCEYGHKWKQSVATRVAKNKLTVCPECRKTRTSFAEQCLLYYVKMLYKGEVQESVCLISGRAYEVDIFIPEQNIAIEYNGTWWHRNKIKEDTEKFALLSKQGIETLYVLEPKGIVIPGSKYFVLDDLDYTSLDYGIRWILSQLKIEYEDDGINVRRDRLSILHNYKNPNIEGHLGKTHPHTLEIWDYERNNAEDIFPYLFTSGSKDKAHWKCPKCGCKWTASVVACASNAMCPICHYEPTIQNEQNNETNLIDNRKTDTRYCLGKLFPEIALEWCYEKNIGLSFENIPPTSKDEVWWRCNNNHIWKDSVFNRVKNNSQCPYCSGEKEVKAFSALYPNLVERFHPTKNNLSINEVSVNNKNKFWWICSCGHEYESTIQTVTKKGHICPVCAGQKIVFSGNSVADKHPDIANMWHPFKNGELTPSHVHSTTSQAVWWKCPECENDFLKSVNDVCSNENIPCPYCSNRKVLHGYNDLATKSPWLSKQWDYEKNEELPEDVLYCAKKSAYWKCEKCGYEWSSSIGARYHRQSGCPSCTSSSKRMSAIKKRCENNRPSYIEYYESNLEELPEALIDSQISSTILRALQTDIQILAMLVEHYHFSIEEIASQLDVTEAFTHILCEKISDSDVYKNVIEKYQAVTSSDKNIISEQYRMTIDSLIDYKILERKTSQEIANETGIGKHYIDRACQKLGIGARRAKTTQQRFGKTRAWFWEEHVGKQRGYADIARELGVTNAIIEKLMKELDIPYLGACREELQIGSD